MRNLLISITLFLLIIVPFNSAIALISYDQQERVFLNTDRDIYVAGESVYLRAQVYNPAGVNAVKSRIVNIVIRDSASKNILELALKLNDNQDYSAFIIPDTLSSGHYEMIAYTNYMRNQGEDTFFRKQLFIANRFDSQQVLTEKFNAPFKSSEIRFFPEGGRLIAGVNQKTGVYVSDKTNQEKEAFLINENSDTLQQLNFSEFYYNTLSFIPEAGVDYYLLFKDEKRFALPEVDESGCGLFLQSNSDDPVLILRPAFEAPVEILIEVESADGVITSQTAELFNKEREIDLRYLPDGLLRFFIKDPAGEIIAQRVWFKESEEDSDYHVYLEDMKPETNQQVEVQIETNKAEYPLWISVSRSDMLFDHSERIIDQVIQRRNSFESLYETALQKGLMPLDVPFNDILLAADLNKESYNEQTVEFPKETKDLSLSGRLVDAESGTALPGVVIFLSSPDSLLNFTYSTTGDDGVFHFILDSYYHNKEVILQVADNDNKTNGRIVIFDRFELNDPFVPFYKGDVGKYVATLTELQKIVSVQKHYGIPVETVNVRPELQKMIPQPLYHFPNQVIYADEYEALPDFVEVARELIFPLRLRKRGDDNYSIRMVNERTGEFFEKEPTVFLDAVPVNNISDIIPLSSSKIRRIEVHNLPWTFGEVDFNGILFIVSENQFYQNLQLPESSERHVVSGFLPSIIIEQKEDVSSEDPELTPDFRPVLKWIPFYNIYKTKKESFSFKTGDLTKDYVIIVSGINHKGIPEGTSVEFKVK